MATSADGSKSGITSFRILTGAIGLISLFHLGVLAVFPEGPSLQTLVVLELLTVGIVAGSTVLQGLSMWMTAQLVGFVVIGLLVTWGLQQTIESLLVVVVSLGVLAALAAYLQHRLELVVLGLVEDGDQA